MLSLALRGLAARKLRGALTAFAILLGVAMVAGTFMLKGSVDKAFDDIFAERQRGRRRHRPARAGVRRRLRPAGVRRSRFPSRWSTRSPGSTASSRPTGAIADDDLDRDPRRERRPHRAGSGRPAADRQQRPSRALQSLHLDRGRRAGHRRRGRDRLDHRRGGGLRGRRRRSRSAAPRGPRSTRSPGSAASAPASRSAARASPSSRWRRRSGSPARSASFDEIDVAGGRRDRPRGARDRDQRGDLPADGRGEDRVPRTPSSRVADIKDGFGFLTTALLVFAGISVFVGAFLIFNTFSITVAQRTREFGMLRTLGASSRQVLTSVIVEALVLGLIASIARDRAGLGFVELVTGAFKAIGFELPQSGIVIVPRPRSSRRSIVGIVATLGSSVVPALRATRVTPLEALRDTADGGRRRRRRRRAWIARGILVARDRRDRLRALRRRLVRCRAAAARPRPDPPLRRHRDAGGHDRPPARVARRPADRAPARRHRPARPREHASQPGPDRDHLGGADDRRRARRLRRGLRHVGRRSRSATRSIRPSSAT